MLLPPKEYVLVPLYVIDDFRDGHYLKYPKNYRLDYYKFMIILKELEEMIMTTSFFRKRELTFADDGHDGLFDGDENLLISHEPGSYTKSNQFS
jgi:hypothetical protein